MKCICTIYSIYFLYIFQSNLSPGLSNLDLENKETSQISDDDDDAIDWNPEKGYKPGLNLTEYNYPRPMAGSGSHMGLTIKLNAEINDYYCSSTNSAGFKLLLHSPVEMSKIKDYGFSIEPGLETRVSISPQLSDASDLIRRVPIKFRQCVFEDEFKLSYFKSYSKKNCQMECQARLLNDSCGCVMYFMPRASENTEICDRSDFACYEKVKLKIDSSNDDEYSCECLPGCTEINYKISISTAQIGNGSYEINDHGLSLMKSEYVKENIALVHFFITQSAYRSFTKEELMGFTDFLSNTGGLLGLFMGFSVISLIEILYFLTLYPFIRVKVKNRIEKKKQMEIEKERQNISKGIIKLYSGRW